MAATFDSIATPIFNSTIQSTLLTRIHLFPSSKPIVLSKPLSGQNLHHFNKLNPIFHTLFPNPTTCQNMSNTRGDFKLTTEPADAITFEGPFDKEIKVDLKVGVLWFMILNPQVSIHANNCCKIFLFTSDHSRKGKGRRRPFQPAIRCEQNNLLTNNNSHELKILGSYLFQ